MNTDCSQESLQKKTFVTLKATPFFTRRILGHMNSSPKLPLVKLYRDHCAKEENNVNESTPLWGIVPLSIN